jgi:hypothetical protein
MSKPTLIEIVQTILSSMDADEVNSISDTTEARSVSRIVEQAYKNIIARSELPEHNDIFGLDASGDADFPTLMLRPSNVGAIEWVKYNIKEEVADADNFVYMIKLPVAQFIDRMHMLDTEAAEVESFTINGRTFYYTNDAAPQYFTILDDNNIIFDSYDSTIEATLQSTKTWCFGRIIPDFQVVDNFVPVLDEQQFPLLINEAKALAFLELKQINHDLAVLETRRQWKNLQKTKHAVKLVSDFDSLPNFGRK